MKCLAHKPAERYTTAVQLADDLRRFLEGRPTVARPLAASARLVKWTAPSTSDRRAVRGVTPRGEHDPGNQRCAELKTLAVLWRSPLSCAHWQTKNANGPSARKQRNIACYMRLV